MTNELDIKFPEINYDGAKAGLYEYLKNDLASPFRGRSYADIFVFAMAIAKTSGIPPQNLDKPMKMPPGAFNGKMREFMRSVMIEEKGDVYSIRDNTALRKMCERYANAGIDTLHMKIRERSADKRGEDVLAELIQSQV